MSRIVLLYINNMLIFMTFIKTKQNNLATHSVLEKKRKGNATFFSAIKNIF